LRVAIRAGPPGVFLAGSSIVIVVMQNSPASDEDGDLPHAAGTHEDRTP